MSRWKRPALVLVSIVSLMAVSAVAFSMTPVGSRYLGPVRAAVVGALQSRPVIDADAQACLSSGGSCLAPQISIGPTATLVDRISVTDTVTVTCGPFLFVEFESGNFEVDQPAGNQVAHAFAGFTPTCDGTSHQFTLTAIAQNAPMHPGTAVATASIDACGQDFNFNFVCQQGSLSQTISLTR
jgi:hypothetical protein